MTYVQDPKTGNYKKVALSAQAESMNLMRHGTEPCQLPPHAILTAAEASLAAHRHNSARGLTHPNDRPAKKPMAFLPKRCREAKSSADLLRIAIKDRPAGAKSTKRNTALIYGDKAGLEKALLLAKGEAE